MDNHPIPQDVSHFQFKLIGDMTIKQFAYLAIGIIIAWFFLSSSLFFLLKFFLVIVFAGTGAFLAFIPIDGRPADTMFLLFLKALFTPNQYLYQKQIPLASPPHLTTRVVQTKIEPAKEVKKENTNQKVTLQALPNQFRIQTPTPNVTQPVFQQPINPPISKPAKADEKPTEELAKKADIIQKEIQESKKEESTEKGEIAKSTHEKTLELEKELSQILSQKQELEKQLLTLQQQLANKKEQVFSPTQLKTPKETQHVRTVPKTLGASVGLPFAPDVPNLVMGIIKDPRGNVLPNILVEVKDKDGNPVRAFKTNPLGQFVSATPLLNGLYTISFEDPKGAQKFDTIEIEATGQVLMPFEVISIDAREELRKELFGAQPR